MERFEQLYTDYLKGKISLQGFQLRLESILGSYKNLSKDDEEFINSSINNIELIIFTIPDDLQKDKVTTLYPKIINYFKKKKS